MTSSEMGYRRGLILLWNGKTGTAACEGAQFPLTRKPRVMDLDIDEIEYMPGVRRYEVLVRGDSIARLLTKEERAYIDAALQRMVLIGLREICGDEGEPK